MNNFRKRIGHLLCLCFTLAILVTCFMASGITASADGSAPICSAHDWAEMGLQHCRVDETAITEWGWYHDHYYVCLVGECRERRAIRVSLPTYINCPAGGGSGGGSNSHTHNYSTTWGAWRKISACRLPG